MFIRFAFRFAALLALTVVVFAAFGTKPVASTAVAASTLEHRQ